MSFGNQYDIRWKDIVDERLPNEVLAPIDKPGFQSKDLMHKDWMERGVVYAPSLLPEDLINDYCKVRQKLSDPGGWQHATPYMQIFELREISLYKPIMSILQMLIGEECGLHLNLTGWVSTQRNWHSDSYLNPEFVGTRYAAVWMALDDIHEDSGPFQYIEGSHKWEVIRRDKVFKYLTQEEQHDDRWPTLTQEWVSKACFDEVLKREAEVTTYLPKRGDVLIWHSNLIHRWSPPKDPDLQLKALIAHYSSLSSRKDMPKRSRHTNGETFFVFD